MKKAVSLLLAMAILLTSAVSVFASERYSITNTNGDLLRSDGALFAFKTKNNTIELIATDVVMIGNEIYTTDYKYVHEALSSKNTAKNILQAQTENYMY